MQVRSTPLSEKKEQPKDISTPPKPQITRFKALFTFEATEEEELGFKEGDIGILLEKYEDNDWCMSHTFLKKQST